MGLLDKANLDRVLTKAAFRRRAGPLELRLGALQRRCRELGVPVVIVFEGWGAAGKGTIINRLLLALDARGCSVHTIKPPTQEERYHPFLWRFWARTPEAGRIAIFDRSWYRGVMEDRVEKLARKREWKRRYDEIGAFERQLSDGGMLILKFFLHISRKEQARRFRALEADKDTAWRVTADDWRHHRRYERYAEAAEEMFRRTGAPAWQVVPAHDRHVAALQVLRTVVEALERAARRRVRPVGAAAAALPRVRGSVLDKVDLRLSLPREGYKRQIERCQDRLRELEHRLYRKRVPAVVVYEGWDAAGKGGNIRRLAQALDPRGYEVVPVGAPNDIEKSHHYLWRFWLRQPKAGHITVFDRSWYGRVLVERVEGFCGEADWKRAYEEIRCTEKQWADAGTVIVKFWLHIDEREQLRRFKERQATAYKRWKITPEDWRNREKRGRYYRAVDEMLLRTSTAWAPWTVVEANDKLHARVKTIKTVIARLEEALD